MTNKQVILIIEDEKNIGNYIETIIISNGYKALRAMNGMSGLSLCTSHHPDLILLDLGLPDIDGSEVLERVRGFSAVPVIVISARTQEAEKVQALDQGADDYITKPFNPLEVIARVKTQLRRYQKYNNPTKKQFFPKREYDIRGLIINKDTHKCFLFGKEISLTPIEFSILWYLCEHQGKVVSTEELFENIWKEKYLDNNNTVMAHIGRLREKLNEPAKNPKFIKTVWGVGYEIE